MKATTLQDAVRRMTSPAASSIGLADWATLRPGALADVVVFDPATIADRATYDAPHQDAAGVQHGRQRHAGAAQRRTHRRHARAGTEARPEARAMTALVSRRGRHDHDGRQAWPGGGGHGMSRSALVLASPASALLATTSTASVAPSGPDAGAGRRSRSPWAATSGSRRSRSPTRRSACDGSSTPRRVRLRQPAALPAWWSGVSLHIAARHADRHLRDDARSAWRSPGDRHTGVGVLADADARRDDDLGHPRRGRHDAASLAVPLTGTAALSPILTDIPPAGMTPQVIRRRSRSSCSGSRRRCASHRPRRSRPTRSPATSAARCT